MSVDHYENFPVASWLCPPRLRPAIRAIYAFARTADDLADEGDRTTDERLALLGRYREALERTLACAGDAGEGAAVDAWPEVFGPLRDTLHRHRLPAAPLRDLLDAFEQDVRNPTYADRAELLDYCRRSADPVGRLLLHLYGLDEREALAQSDAVCSALQLINFWQDLSVDAPRGRHYVPLADARRHGVDLQQLEARADGPAVHALVRDLCDWARDLMLRGAPLVHRLPGRAGWELRFVVQGGLRVLDHIARMDHATLLQRPTIGAADAPLLVWRALTMRAAAPAPELAA